MLPTRAAIALYGSFASRVACAVVICEHVRASSSHADTYLYLCPFYAASPRCFLATFLHPSACYRRSRDLKRSRSAINSRSVAVNTFFCCFCFDDFGPSQRPPVIAVLRRPRRTFVAKQARPHEACKSRASLLSGSGHRAARRSAHSTVHQPAAVSTSGTIGHAWSCVHPIECCRSRKRTAPSLSLRARVGLGRSLLFLSRPR